MIVRMRKVSLVVLDKHREESLLDLRRLGLLHIKYIKSPSSPAIDLLEKQIEDIQKALWIASKYPLGNREERYIDKSRTFLHSRRASLQRKVRDKKGILSLATQIISWDKEKEQCSQDKEDIENKISWYKDWGEFSLSSLKELARQGVYIRLYKCSKRELRILRETKVVEVIKRQGNNYYIAVVSFMGKEDINLADIIPPDKELSTLKKELKVIEDRILSLDSLLKEKAGYREVFLNYLANLGKSLDFNKVKLSMQAEEEISCLQGFIPAGEVAKLVNLANSKGWAYLIQEPENPQEVPTLIKNPPWLRIIEPVFKFMGTLPGYNELDISFTFLLFFSLFFALLIGDAGYGLVFLLVTYLARRKLSRLPPEPFILMYVLSFATIIWGALSGTWFGLERIGQLPIFNYLVIDRINSFVEENQDFVMYLCFLIGVIQLSVAHAIVALRYINNLKAIAQIGWIGILWSVFFFIGKLVLNRPLPEYCAWLLIGGVSLVILFSASERNFLKGICVSLANLPLKLINSFADVLSYLRLFVIGYVTVTVAANFNTLAGNLGKRGFLGIVIAALIILFGHSLNVALGLLSVLVHGIRLNMLEFSVHLDMQWSGIEYKPFKE